MMQGICFLTRKGLNLGQEVLDEMVGIRMMAIRKLQICLAKATRKKMTEFCKDGCEFNNNRGADLSYLGDEEENDRVLWRWL